MADFIIRNTNDYNQQRNELLFYYFIKPFPSEIQRKFDMGSTYSTKIVQTTYKWMYLWHPIRHHCEKKNYVEKSRKKRSNSINLWLNSCCCIYTDSFLSIADEIFMVLLSFYNFTYIIKM